MIWASVCLIRQLLGLKKVQIFCFMLFFCFARRYIYGSIRCCKILTMSRFWYPVWFLRQIMFELHQAVYYFHCCLLISIFSLLSVVC
jgi:hypothetical protein